MKKKRFLYLLLPALTIALEALPYGAVVNFAQMNESGSMGTLRKTYSYFSLTPYGYANFAPLITAVLTCGIVVLLIGYCVTGKSAIVKCARALSGIGAIVSLCPLLYGISYFSVVGLLITVSLAAEWLFLTLERKRETV